MRLLALFLLTSGCAAVNPLLKFAGKGMSLLKPVFSLENKLQGTLLGSIGQVDREEVKAELAALDSEPCVIYTYGLSPFSTEALSLLESTGVSYEKRELGLEWFLLGPKASATRLELEYLTGQSSLPHIFIGGEHIGGLSTGSPGLIELVESGELQAKVAAASKMKIDPKKKTLFQLPF